MKKNLLTLILLITTVCWSNSVFAQPANNECSGAQPIAAAPGFPLQFGPYDNTDATTEASDPAAPAAFGEGTPSLENTLWYTLVGDGNTYFIYTSSVCAGFEITDTYIDGGDSQMAVYTGGCGALELVASSEDEPHVPEFEFNVNFPAGVVLATEAGVEYHIMIDGFAGSAGEFCIVVTDWVCDPNVELAEGSETAVSLCTGDSFLPAINDATLNFGGASIGTGLTYEVVFQMTSEDPAGGHPRLDPSFLGFIGTDFELDGSPDGQDPFGFGLDCIWLTPTSAITITGVGSYLFFDCQAVGTESIEVCFLADGEGDCGDNCTDANVDLAEGTSLSVTLCLDDVVSFAPNEATINYGGLVGDNPTPVWIENTQDPMGNPLGTPGGLFLPPLDLIGDGVADTLWYTLSLIEDIGPDGTIITWECQPLSETIQVIWYAEDDPACAVVECGIADGDAGTISTMDPTTICVDGEPDVINFTSSYMGGGNYGYVVTDATTGTILTPGVVGTTEFSNNFDDAGLGICNAYGVTWENDENTAFVQGGNLGDIIAAFGEDACYDITEAVAITREECLDPLATSDASTSVGDDTYTVSFSITGGSGNYSADGGTIGMDGTFTSDAIACGTDYSFTVSDNETGETSTISGDAPCEEQVDVCPIVLDVVEECTTIGSDGGIVTITILGGTAPYTSAGSFNGEVDGNVVTLIVADSEDYEVTVTDSEGCEAVTVVGVLVCSKCKNVAGSVIAGAEGTTACGENGSISVSVSSDGFVDTNPENPDVAASVRNFILHTDSTDPIGSAVSTNSTGVFTRGEAGGAGTYYITTIVGPDANGDGFVDEPLYLNDECAFGSDPLAITFADSTALDVTVQEDCDQNVELVTVNVTINNSTPGTMYIVTGTYMATEDDDFSFSGIADGDSYEINIVEVGGCGTFNLLSDPVICQKEDAVEWLSFDGEVQTAGNFLQWMTASETNNEYFAVERSLDGKNFETIATVKAVGESVVPTGYNYLDRAAPSGTSYYRVTQFDFDGQNDATNVISLTRGEGSFDITNVRPVPAVDYVEITYTAINNGSVEVNVYDLTGRVMLKASVNATSGVNNQVIDISSYPAGIYMVSLNNGTDVATQRLVKE